MAISTKGKVKYKGAFEIQKELHKDNSFKVVPLAISNYFVNRIPVEETVKNHRNIYDFCGRQKFGKDSYGETHTIKDEEGLTYNEALEIFNRDWTDYEGNTYIKKEWIDNNLPYDRMSVHKEDALQSILYSSRRSISNVEKQQKNVRYYISTPGHTFIKQYKKGTSEIINKGFEVTVFNDFVEKEWNEYNINYNFYIMECKKILEVIETKQMSLF